MNTGNVGPHDHDLVPHDTVFLILDSQSGCPGLISMLDRNGLASFLLPNVCVRLAANRYLVGNCCGGCIMERAVVQPKGDLDTSLKYICTGFLFPTTGINSH